LVNAIDQKNMSPLLVTAEAITNTTGYTMAGGAATLPAFL
jgi:hypothetical protein